MRDRVKAGQSLGGRHKATRSRVARNLPDDMRALGAKLLDAFDAVYAGKMDGKTAAALSSLATAYVRVWEAGVTATTLRDVDAMLKAFESGDIDAFTAAADAVSKAA